MTNLEQAARQALEALDLGQSLLEQSGSVHHATLIGAYNTLRQALEQPKQEPVRWMYDWKNDGLTVTDWVTSDKGEAYSPTKGHFNIRPLYTEPMAAKVNTEMIEALRAFLRAPSVGSSGYGSSTIVVQDFHLRAARAAIEKAEGTV